MNAPAGVDRPGVDRPGVDRPEGWRPSDRPEGWRPSDRHLALVGPTASGKSALALELARRHRSVEIVTVDSMQVYRGMDIGTATPTASEQLEVPHHLLDVVDPDEDYTVSRYQHDCLAVLRDIESRGCRALLVGGTGLYLRAVTDDLEIPGQFPATRADLEAEADTAALFARLEDLDPVAAERMEPRNRRRVIRALEVTLGSGRPFSSFGPGLGSYPPLPFPVAALEVDRVDLDERIATRYARQMADGFLDEVRALLARPAGLSRTARQALGYSELLDHIEHGTPLDAALATAIQRTRRFARRQQRWFRRDPRIEWLPAGDASDTAPGGGAASETAAGPVGAPPIAAGGAAAAQAGGTAASGPEDPKRTEAGDGDPTENALARLSSLLGD